MVGVAESVLRTDSPGQLPGLQHWPTALQSENGRFVPGARSDALSRSVNPAELAQARIFTSALQSELVRLTELETRLGGPSADCRAAEFRREPRDLGQIHAGIIEVRRLLEGLRGRFGMAD